MHDDHEALFEVLRHSLPHDRSGQADPSHPFWAAARALGRIAEAEALLTR